MDVVQYCCIPVILHLAWMIGAENKLKTCLPEQTVLWLLQKEAKRCKKSAFRIVCPEHSTGQE